MRVCTVIRTGAAELGGKFDVSHYGKRSIAPHQVYRSNIMGRHDIIAKLTYRGTIKGRSKHCRILSLVTQPREMT